MLFSDQDYLFTLIISVKVSTETFHYFLPVIFLFYCSWLAFLLIIISYSRRISYSLQVCTFLLLVVSFGQHILKEQQAVSYGEREDLLLPSLILWFNRFTHQIYMQGLSSNSPAVTTNMQSSDSNQKKKDFWSPLDTLHTLCFFSQLVKLRLAYNASPTFTTASLLLIFPCCCAAVARDMDPFPPMTAGIFTVVSFSSARLSDTCVCSMVLALWLL